MKRYVILIMVLCLLLPSIAQAQVNMKKVGQSTMNFLKVGVSPRAAGMGDAYTAVCEDVESVFYNPAGIAGITSGYNAFISQTQWIANIKYTAGAFGKSFANAGAFAISVLAVDYGEIQGALPTEGGEGYELTGNVDVGAYAFGLAYARQISSQFYMGGLLQYVRQQLGQNTLSTGTIDNIGNKVTLNFGVKYFTSFKKFRFAMSIRNFSTEVKYEEYNSQMPMEFMVGAGIDLLDFIYPGHSGQPLLLSTEFKHPNSYTERLNIGGEYSIMGLISFRAGYEFNRDLAGFSAGFGVLPQIGSNKIAINYSYSSFEVFDDVSRFSLSVLF